MSSSQYNPENELDGTEVITLTDESGRSLECYIENALETDEITYLLLMPIDTPVVILAWDDETEQDDYSNAVLVEDEAEIEKIFPDAKAVLAELDLMLKMTGYTLTVSGELPPLEDEGILTLELESDDQESLEPEELQFLVSFYHLEQKYSIYTPLAPLLFLATYDQFGNIQLVSPEDGDIQPILEELLFEEMD
jgi:hypothetical protein